MLLDFNVDIKVNTAGLFKAELPKEILERLKAINMMPEGYCNYNAIAANTMDEIERAIDKAVKPLIEFKEIENKVVIRYTISTACAYTKTTDGQYLPNLCDKTLEYIPGKNDGWHGGSETRDASSRGDYHVGIVIKLMRKITNEYGDGIKKTYYEWIRHGEVGENGEWLVSLIGMGDETTFGRSYSAQSEIDYNEQNALFFRKFITGLFTINDYVSQLNDSNVLQNMILRQKALPVSMEQSLFKEEGL